MALKIERILSPLIGHFMAKMALRSQCERLGITPDQLEIHHLDALSEHIGSALTCSGYNDDIRRIIDSIKMIG